MTIEVDKKIGRETYLLFKNDKNKVNFDLSTQKSRKFAFWLVISGGFWPKNVIFHDTRVWSEIWRKPNSWFGK